MSEQDKNVKLSDNERLKRESNFLRGTIEQDLKDEITGGFTADNFQLIRFHGMYQQDDRDIRPERAKQKLEPLHNVMLRARMPGGIIKPEQWLAIDKFADEKTIEGKVNVKDNLGLSVDDLGEAASDLKPIGKGIFGDVEVEVVTKGYFLEAGTTIKIISIESNRIIVQATN